LRNVLLAPRALQRMRAIGREASMVVMFIRATVETGDMQDRVARH